MITISKDWTHEEKLKIVVIITDMIRDDIRDGTYNSAGKPNIQSVHEFIAMSPEECEEYRDGLIKILENHAFAGDSWEKWKVSAGLQADFCEVVVP